MEPDKRRFVRKRTDQLLYAEVGPDNGSILLNLSEDGCSFQSIAPVRGKEVHFSVSVGDGRKLEGDGRMVWSDTAKKTGGLRFLNPSEELQEQVLEWLQETMVTADGRLDPAVVGARAKRRRKRLREEARAAAELARKEGARQAAEAESEARVESQLLMEAPVAKATPSSVGWLDDAARLGERKPVATWRGLSTMALVALLFMTLVAYRQELGHFVMSMGSSIAGDQQKTGATAESGVVDAGAAVSHTDSPPAVPQAVQQAAPDTKETGAEAVPASTEVSPPNSTNAQTGVPKRSSSPAVNPPPASPREDVSSLWTLVENGDMHAEVTLANRYVRGDGVPQSCAQARILLEAAAKRGSTEAKQKLDDLGQAGCP